MMSQMKTRIKTYRECIRLPTWEERVKYLQTNSAVGIETYGFDRHINQSFYRSKEWRSFRDSIIVRDNACDLACEGYDIHDAVTIHHINPITMDDIVNHSHCVFDPDNVITTMNRTHNIIHYSQVVTDGNRINIRKQDDTIPWRRK